MEKIAELFESMVEGGSWHGGQLAVCHKGELVLELAGGLDGRGNPVRLESILCMLSTTKMLTSMVMHMLHDQGFYDYDDPVANYWPQFAQKDKDEITIRDVLSHRAGLFPKDRIGLTTWKEWDKANGVRQLVQDMKPAWPPGSANGYSNTYGQVLNELIQIWTKKNTGQVLRDEICKPLGVEGVYIGIPEEAWARYAPFADNPFIVRAAGVDSPPGGEGHFFNSYHIMKQCLAWGSGAACTRDLARLANVFAYEGLFGGKTFFSKETFGKAIQPTNQPDTVDKNLGAKARWGLGLLVGLTEGHMGTSGPLYGHTAPARTCGHIGGSSALTWADPDNRLTMAFISTGTKGRVSYQPLSDAVRQALA